MPRIAAAGLVVAALVQGITADTWCGKNYQAGSPTVAPGGEFPIPSTSTSPLLAFRCSPAIKPYLPEDASASQSFVIDAPVVYSQISGASAIDLPTRSSASPLEVTVTIGGKTFATGSLAPNATTTLSFSLKDLTPQAAPYDVECTAKYGSSSTYTAKSQLSYLPAPPAGRSVTKMDLRTGALLAKPANGKGGDYQTVFPFGFYTSFDYLSSNLANIDAIASQGYTVIHPIPPFSSTSAVAQVIQRMEQAGIYLMYDMRYTYQNSASVTEEVNRIKDSPALLLWYTGDEPDGTSDPFSATSTAYSLINSLDGYHPISLVLNCENYHWSEYSAGGDIIMQDTYPIGINATWSVRWGTPVTPDFGDCGCDNCKGAFEDISTRMDEFTDRRFINGWEHSKSLWTVPQGFGAAEYWSRVPTGPEFVVENALAINHGARGSVSWSAPASADVTAAGAGFSSAIKSSLKDYILNPAAKFQHKVVDRVDVGMWTVGGKTLVLATNLNYASKSFDLSGVPLVGNQAKTGATQAYNNGAKISGTTITLDSTGTGAFIVGDGSETAPTTTSSASKTSTSTSAGTTKTSSRMTTSKTSSTKTTAPVTSTTSSTSAAATTTGSTGSGSCQGVAAWSSSVAYNGGQKVTYNGHLWTAKWWVYGSTPGGASGEWTDGGAC
ncbi:hypothetical protein GSI_11503 [Ganoderma sinense ZZ0214-1]|uniref:Chitin-binding type-3 domain-containing protein n=1 Tax=Ganoderma sinense ZZ0214-1 TaxID=1077348 RepID=A0A2G8RW64_9APHY|nr:hypothetical protein GSI_11503 [Ganoderma sinense ZZ0214-1]